MDVKLANKGTRLLGRVLVQDLDSAIGVELRLGDVAQLLLVVDGCFGGHRVVTIAVGGLASNEMLIYASARRGSNEQTGIDSPDRAVRAGDRGRPNNNGRDGEHPRAGLGRPAISLPGLARLNPKLLPQVLSD